VRFLFRNFKMVQLTKKWEFIIVSSLWLNVIQLIMSVIYKILLQASVCP
jgi:hypothetical protein